MFISAFYDHWFDFKSEHFDLQVIYDKQSGRSRGFGFVTMSTIEEVEAATQQFNGFVSDFGSFNYEIPIQTSKCQMFLLTKNQ